MTSNLKYTIEYKTRLVEEQKKSGIKAKQWCTENDIVYGSFKSFSRAIRDHHFSNNPQFKSTTQTKESRDVSWISTAEIISNESKTKEVNENNDQATTCDLTIQCIIEVGVFKIHIPENIKSSSLKTLVEVLKQCS